MYIPSRLHHLTEFQQSHLNLTDEPAAPLNVTVNQVKRVPGGGFNISTTWMQPQNFDQFDIDFYNIAVTSTSGIQHITTACGECTNTTGTVTENPSNMLPNTTFTVTISARNKCGENGPTATDTYTLSK